MAQAFSISIDQVVDLLGLVRDPKSEGRVKYWVDCPFCGGKAKMNINSEKDVYRCVVCSGDRKHQGALDLYGRVAHGTELRYGAGGNSKELYKALLKDLGIDNNEYRQREQLRANRSREVIEIEPASDEDLDRVYSALLSLPQLKLSASHWRKLTMRGLQPDEINNGGYASLRPVKDVISRYQGSDEITNSLRPEIKKAKDENREIQKMSFLNLALGILLAEELENQGLTLDRVPGFFRLGSHWCFRYIPGMLIPTRNRKGQVIGLQVRRDSEGLRYLTLSSQGFPEGVTTRISRTHFPLANAPFDESTEVVFTEGPLKADVALATMIRNGSKRTAFIAIPGINNVSELSDIAKDLIERGVTTVYEAFDMDKCTNINVMRGVVGIRRILREAGLKVISLYWDQAYAMAKHAMLKELLETRKIRWEVNVNLWQDLKNMTKALVAAQVDPGTVLSDGVELRAWDSNTKGIDDYVQANSGEDY